jgi:hypothetical protein
MLFKICCKDINVLSPVEVATLLSRLSWSDSESDSSIQKELHKRYVNVQPGQHPSMMLAFVWLNDELLGWVGTRYWPEKFKGNPVIAQTVECFVDEKYRRRGIARLGLQALISAGFIDRSRVVSVYDAAVVKLAEQCGCKIVILCDT